MCIWKTEENGWFFPFSEWLEGKSSFAGIAVESLNVPDDGGTKNYCWSPLKKEMFSPHPLGPLPVQDMSSVEDDKGSIENHTEKTQLETELGKPMQEDRRNEACQLTGFREASAETSNMPRNKALTPSELPRQRGDDFDLLSSFIMLRSKQMVTQNEESKDVEIQGEGNSWHMEA